MSKPDEIIGSLYEQLLDFTKDKADCIREKIRQGYDIFGAAQAAGIPPRKIRAWMKDSDLFNLWVHGIKAERFGELQEQYMNLLGDPKIKPLEKAMELRRHMENLGMDYGKKSSSLEIKNTDQVISPLSKDEFEKMEEEHMLKKAEEAANKGDQDVS